jgi:hypothetical protein
MGQHCSCSAFIEFQEIGSECGQENYNKGEQGGGEVNKCKMQKGKWNKKISYQKTTVMTRMMVMMKKTYKN